MQYKKSVQILSNSDFFFSFLVLFCFHLIHFSSLLIPLLWMSESGDLYSLCNTELTVVLVVVICIFSSVGVLMLVFG